MQSISEQIRCKLQEAMAEVEQEQETREGYVKKVFEPLCTQSIFHHEFEQHNIMCKCSLVCDKHPSFALDLTIFNRPEDNMFYHSTALPSLLMCLKDAAPVVLCSYKGRITMTGGCSLEEIQYCLGYYCEKLIYYLGLIYPYKTFRFENFQICNRFFTTRLNYNVDLFNCACHIEKLKSTDSRFKDFKVKYCQRQINLLYIFPPTWLFGDSLRISVGAEGGVNIFGVKKDYEVVLIATILSILLTPSLRQKHDLEADLAYRKKVAAKRIEKQQLKKARLIEKWTKGTRSKDETSDEDSTSEESWQ